MELPGYLSPSTFLPRGIPRLLRGVPGKVASGIVCRMNPSLSLFFINLLLILLFIFNVFNTFILSTQLAEHWVDGLGREFLSRGYD